jgi:hypothetical protein
MIQNIGRNFFQVGEMVKDSNGRMFTPTGMSLSPRLVRFQVGFLVDVHPPKHGDPNLPMCFWVDGWTPLIRTIKGKQLTLLSTLVQRLFSCFSLAFS